MSVFKTTFSRALNIYASNNANIPFPNVIASGVSTSTIAFKLVNSSGAFIQKNIKTGDIVYSDSSAATVITVDSETQLTLNANIFTSGTSYRIFQASPQTGLGNTGAFLYIGETGDIEVVTIGGDTVSFYAVPAGTTLPIQVIKLTGTTVIGQGNIVALW